MLDVNMKTRAASQTTVPFNSMCKFGDTYLGATDEGLFKICGYADNTVEIPALIKSGEMDFGTNSKKRFRFFYFGLETNGALLFKVYCDGVEAESYTVEPSVSGELTIRVPISREHVGRYWAWSVENVDGAFFALYSVRALPVILHPNRGQ